MKGFQCDKCEEFIQDGNEVSIDIRTWVERGRDIDEPIKYEICPSCYKKIKKIVMLWVKNE